jgi:uncharacterized membrane protein
MIVFVVMLAAIGAARAAGASGISGLDDWHAAVRAGLAVMFAFTGIAHFTSTRADLVRMVPPRLPQPELLVTLTGVAELAGAAGLLIPAAARWAAWSLALLLVAMFPANLYASRSGHTIGGRPHTKLAIRAPLQAVWIALLLWAAPPA